MPLRIVLDTNCLFSAFLSYNHSREVINLARKKKVILITSRILNADLSELFHKKIDGEQLRINRFLNTLSILTSIVFPTDTLSVITRDIDDNRVLEAAIAGECDYIVTGDKDLLELKDYKGIKIFTPKDFLEEFSRAR